MEDRALRLYIRHKLENGNLLPHNRVPHVWGGPGNGETCDGCEETITRDQLMMEGVGVRGDQVEFHVKCFYVWVSERTEWNVSLEPRDDGRDSEGSTSQGLMRRTTDISTYFRAPSHAPPPGTPVAGP